MKLTTSRIFVAGVSTCWATCALAASTPTSTSHDQYLKELKIANDKVQSQKDRAGNANALSSAIVRKLFGRYYRVGDQWDIAAWQYNGTMSRMTSQPELLETRRGHGAIFHYEVTDVKYGAEPQVTLKITQRNEAGLKVVDPKIESVSLTLGENLLQKKKAYRLTGRAEAIAVSPNGVHTDISPLELYPLDAPDVVTVDGKPVESVPALPADAQPVADALGYRPDASRSLWFEQDDFFGRPLQILWQHGDPWPAYVRTSNGVAILIRKGGA